MATKGEMRRVEVNNRRTALPVGVESPSMLPVVILDAGAERGGVALSVLFILN